MINEEQIEQIDNLMRSYYIQIMKLNKEIKEKYELVNFCKGEREKWQKLKEKITM